MYDGKKTGKTGNIYNYICVLESEPLTLYNNCIYGTN